MAPECQVPRPGPWPVRTWPTCDVPPPTLSVPEGSSGSTSPVSPVQTVPTRPRSSLAPRDGGALGTATPFRFAGGPRTFAGCAWQSNARGWVRTGACAGSEDPACLGGGPRARGFLGSLCRHSTLNEWCVYQATAPRVLRPGLKSDSRLTSQKRRACQEENRQVCARPVARDSRRRAQHRHNRHRPLNGKRTHTSSC
jgi:hypothetical protein